jgi:CubicO group peptidase (beta-lactamase class C family)
LPGTNSRNLFTFAPVPGYAADTQAELANTHLKHLPGELAVYCNDGFTMVEQIVLAMTGQSFANFVEANILAPLKMTNSSYLTTVPSDGSFSYPFANGTQYQEFVNAYATGGLSSTPGDMMNLAQMILGGGVFQGQRVVSAAGIAQMGTDQSTGLLINPSPEWRWGLGWDSVQQPALQAAGVLGWEKDGGTAFYSSEFFVVPQAQLALMVTGNSGYDARKLAEMLVLSALKEDGTIASLPAKISTTAPPAASAPGIANAAGIYGNSDSPLQVIANPDGSLQLNQWDGAKRAWKQVGAYHRYRVVSIHGRLRNRWRRQRVQLPLCDEARRAGRGLRLSHAADRAAARPAGAARQRMATASRHAMDLDERFADGRSDRHPGQSAGLSHHVARTAGLCPVRQRRPSLSTLRAACGRPRRHVGQGAGQFRPRSL